MSALPRIARLVLWSAVFGVVGLPARVLAQNPWSERSPDLGLAHARAVTRAQLGDALDVESTVLQWYWKATGLHPWCYADAEGCHSRILEGASECHGFPLNFGNLSTGSSITHADIELFLRLATVLMPGHIFIVGNAWGYSTLVLSYIFGGASVDVIDAGNEGLDNLDGIRLTRIVAAQAKRNIAVFHGLSPKATHRAMRSKGEPYELAFIDGAHTNTNMFEDFVGIYPHLAERSVVVLHDVGSAQIQHGMYTILCTFPDMAFAYYTSLAYPKPAASVGTGFMYRGFPDDAFSNFHSLEVPYRCGEVQIHKQPVVSFVPKLLTERPSLCLAGILEGRFCCSPQCHKCGGLTCDYWPGSGAECCHGSIKNVCTSDAGPPPCVYPESLCAPPCGNVNPAVWM